MHLTTPYIDHAEGVPLSITVADALPDGELGQSSCCKLIPEFIGCLSFSSSCITDPNVHLVIAVRELDVVTEWKTLGLYLGLDISTLRRIEQDEQTTSCCQIAMLHSWLNIKDYVKDKGGATRSALVNALRIMDENVLAKRIETKGSSLAHSRTPPSELIPYVYVSFTYMYFYVCMYVYMKHTVMTSTGNEQK